MRRGHYVDIRGFFLVLGIGTRVDRHRFGFDSLASSPFFSLNLSSFRCIRPVTFNFQARLRDQRLVEGCDGCDEGNEGRRTNTSSYLSFIEGIGNFRADHTHTHTSFLFAPCSFAVERLR